MEDYNFGQRLQGIRKLCHLTQKQAAERIGINRKTLSSYERNIKYPSIQKLKALAQLYKVSSDYLLGLNETESISLEDVPIKKRPLVEDLMSILKHNI